MVELRHGLAVAAPNGREVREVRADHGEKLGIVGPRSHSVISLTKVVDWSNYSAELHSPSSSGIGILSVAGRIGAAFIHAGVRQGTRVHERPLIGGLPAKCGRIWYVLR